jgi:imidazole glycerol phosphate synthase glutamine amidotransferase subunit
VIRKTIGIVDYGVGNHASVQRAFQALDYRCRISRDPEILAGSDLIVLPGVGAYPAAMSSLGECGLVEFLRERARRSHPMIGLCLGMQLLADESLEHGTTAGLGLIPGQVVPLEPARWHIGWNSVEVVNGDKLLLPSDGESVYFNHSFVFNAPQEYQVCVSRLDQPFVVGVRRGNVVGLQFHPEKSQRAGRIMLKNLVEGLTCA